MVALYSQVYGCVMALGWVPNRLAAQVFFCKFVWHQTERWGWFSMVRYTLVVCHSSLIPGEVRDAVERVLTMPGRTPDCAGRPHRSLILKS